MENHRLNMPIGFNVFPQIAQETDSPRIADLTICIPSFASHPYYQHIWQNRDDPRVGLDC